MKYLNLIIRIFIFSFLLSSLGSCSQPSNNSTENQEQVKIETKKEEFKTEPEPTLEPIGTGKITTKVDGMDVKKVNLWSSASSKRTIVCSMTNNQEVKILEDEDPYFLVESIKDSKCKGYCMKGFVKMK